MISYYGGKTNVVKLYPSPRYDHIVEPFAGSARYSLQYFERNVTLIDKYEPLIKMWRWLRDCSPGDIKKLPRLKTGDKLSNYKWSCEEERFFMGYIIGYASVFPRNTVTPRLIIRPNHINFGLNRVADNLYKIRHWAMAHGDYRDFPFQSECTWFIDAPYMQGGEKYKHSFKAWQFEGLAKWCRSRKGQVIVCEAGEADWLPFKMLGQNRVVNKHINELIWTNENIDPQPPKA